jgi:hypothetical protein
MLNLRSPFIDLPNLSKLIGMAIWVAEVLWKSFVSLTQLNNLILDVFGSR